MIHFYATENRSVLKRGPVDPWTEDFSEACRTWKLYVETAMDFSARNPARCLTLVHEELVDEPEDGFSAIFEFAGIQHEEGPAEYFRTHRLNSSFQEDADEPPERELLLSNPWEEWTEDQRLIFSREAGDTLLKCGFATEAELANR